MRRPDGRMDGRRRRGCWATEILGIRPGRVDGQAEGTAPGRRGAGPSARARGRQYIVVWRWPSAGRPDAETDAPTPAETATSPASTCSPREPGAACRPRAKPAEPACPPARASSSASASSAVSTWGARFMARVSLRCGTSRLRKQSTRGTVRPAAGGAGARLGPAPPSPVFTPVKDASRPAADSSPHLALGRVAPAAPPGTPGPGRPPAGCRPARPGDAVQIRGMFGDRSAVRTPARLPQLRQAGLGTARRLAVGLVHEVVAGRGQDDGVPGLVAHGAVGLGTGRDGDEPLAGDPFEGEDVLADPAEDVGVPDGAHPLARVRVLERHPEGAQRDAEAVPGCGLALPGADVGGG